MVLDYHDSFSEVSKIKSIKIVDNEVKSASITFGVPTYKRVNTLRSTLDSIISQNGNYAFNIIVSDNNPERDDETERMILSSFANTKEAKWIDENAYLYGFIVRYPKNKTNITGYIYEPWHIRYLGKKTAKMVYESKLTLEEYLGVD